MRKEEEIDLVAVRAERLKLKAELAALGEKMDGYLKELWLLMAGELKNYLQDEEMETLNRKARHESSQSIPGHFAPDYFAPD